MIDTQFLAGLEKFNLIVRKRVTSNYSGQKKSIAQGKGMIFKDHRIYAPGDDFRNIDWKIFARTDHLMIKNFEEERNLTVHILVDKSASMDFGKPAKFDYASMVGVGYAYLALKKNDKFQFATFAEDVDFFMAKRGMSQLAAMIDYLNKTKVTGKTDLVSVAQKYRKIIGSKAMVIIISDFLSPVDDIKKALGYFSGNDVEVIQVLHPIEKNPDMEGDFKLKDSESDTAMRTYFSPLARIEYLKRLENHTSEIEKECNRTGVKFYQVTSDTPIFDTFYKILH